MIYTNSVKAKFINRPNRFIANVLIGDTVHEVHVKNTGRCKELLKEGCSVYLTKADNKQRKTEYDLICVEKLDCGSSVTLFNIDSQAANQVAEEWIKKGGLFDDVINVRREVKYDNSRFDFLIETETEKIFLEVKGVTLDDNGIALFPDAPTGRGIKHINELISCIEDGYGAYILFVLQYKGAEEFRANSKTHREFEDALKKAVKSGVKVVAVDCIVTPESLEISEFVRVNI